ncbi:outer membrane protein assembly factor BamD, partial [candidate division KSB1 bacterium]|nr:outer membrane protein assembly factor BamD [candidate division KSB1 bacterium]
MVLMLCVAGKMAAEVEQRKAPHPWAGVFALLQTPKGEAQDDAYQAYKSAQNFVYEQRWAEAITQLQAFLSKYAGSKYAADANFWICYSQEKRGDDAEKVYNAYKTFIKNYPRSGYVDEAKANMILLAAALAKAGKTGYQAEVQAMRQDADEELRLQALYALGQHDDEETVNTLKSLLASEKSPNVRRKIVYVFGNIDSPEAVKTLSEIATNDPDAGVRKSAVMTIGNSDWEGAVAFLTRIAKSDPEPEISKAAVYAIANQSSREAVNALSDILGNATSLEIRKAALYSLGNTGEETALPALEKTALQGGDPKLQEAAVYAIGNMGSAEALQSLQSIFAKSTTASVRRATAYAIANTGEPAAATFLANSAMTEPDDKIAEALVYA